MREHRRDEIQIVGSHLAQLEALGRDRRLHVRFHSSWDSTRNARLNLLDAFSHAITPVSSTIAVSSQ